MMRAPSGWAVAVRTPSGSIEAQRHDLPKLTSRSRWAKVPLVRGILVLGESLTLGFRALSWSAQKSVGEDEKELSKLEIGGSMLLAFVLFAGLFIVAPAAVANLISGDSEAVFAILEAVIRIVIFVGYIWLLGRSEEIRRVFQYHGAEHMSIHAFEAGQPLSVESVQRYDPEHPRCGTSFLLLVIAISIVLFTFVGRPDWPLLVASRVIGIPLVAGISYEILKWSGTNGGDRLAAIMAAPGLWLQKLTTGRPDDSMVEVAITSLLSALSDDLVRDVIERGGVPQVAADAYAR